MAAAARGDRARLEFLLELGHELRTPAGVIAGYLSLASRGEVDLQEAVDVASTQADELCRLLDALLGLAQAQLAQRDCWRQRVGAAHAESERLRLQTTETTARARELLERLRVP